jgi:hypothetical protein
MPELSAGLSEAERSLIEAAHAFMLEHGGRWRDERSTLAGLSAAWLDWRRPDAESRYARWKENAAGSRNPSPDAASAASPSPPDQVRGRLPRGEGKIKAPDGAPFAPPDARPASERSLEDKRPRPRWRDPSAPQTEQPNAEK